MKYSKTTGGFYIDKIHGENIPVDARSVSAERHAELMAAQSSGLCIVGDENGDPIAVEPETLYTLDQARSVKSLSLQRAYDAARRAQVSYMNTAFQADDDSQTVLSKTLAALTPIGSAPAGFYWLDAENNQVPMTLAELQGLSSVMFDQGWSAFQHLQAKKEAVNVATTVADVNSITWESAP